MYLQKVISRNIVGVLKVNDENSRIRSRIWSLIRLVKVRIFGSGSVQKFHGSATLLKWYNGLQMGSTGTVAREMDSVVLGTKLCRHCIFFIRIYKGYIIAFKHLPGTAGFSFILCLGPFLCSL